MFRTSYLFIALALFLIQSSTYGEHKPVTIGVISGLSGAAAKWNTFQNMGVRLAAEEITQKGFPLKLIFEDSQTKAPKVIAAYNKLFDLDRVDGILVNDFGFVVAPLLPLVKRQKRFMMAISLPHDRYCSEAPGYLYSSTSQFSYSHKAFERFFDLHPEVKRIAIFAHDDPEWGNAYRKIWETIAKARGVTIVETFLSADLTPDFKTPIAKALQKKPDALFVAHEPETFIKAV